MTDIIIETDWNNVDARGIVRHTGQGLPRVWARDGDEEVPVLGFLVDFSKTRAAQYAARPADDSLDAAAELALGFGPRRCDFGCQVCEASARELTAKLGGG